MTKADLKLIDEAIIKHGDDFWKDPNDDDEGGWIVVELLEILKKEGLDLKIIRKK